jgi:geranylgeranyl pyrophosphate synthase
MMNGTRRIMKEVLSLLEGRSVKALEQARKELLSIDVQSIKARKALEYYAENWNDIIHPGILSLACEAVGGDPETIVPVQVALLLVNAAIDIHDDIIDQSKTKNGRQTVFGKFGEKIALLLGDAMLIRGLILLNDSLKHFPHEIAKNVVSTFQKYLFELGNAHLYEIDFMETFDASPLRYFHVLEKKGSIIGMLMRIGAIVGGGVYEQIESLGNYGEILGTLIAIREEFIDIFEQDELKSRLENKYPPLPVLCASNNPRVKRLIYYVSTRPKISNSLIERLIEAVFRDNKVKELIEKMHDMSREALKHIKKLRLKKSLEYQLKIILLGIFEDLQ